MELNVVIIIIVIIVGCLIICSNKTEKLTVNPTVTCKTITSKLPSIYPGFFQVINAGDVLLDVLDENNQPLKNYYILKDNKIISSALPVNVVNSIDNPIVIQTSAPIVRGKYILLDPQQRSLLAKSLKTFNVEFKC